MKKITAYILCIVLILGNMYSAFAYSDITEDYSWASDAIRALTENRTISGYPDGRFLPEQNVTRAELCKMICVLFGAKDEVAYPDVTTEDWYYEFVAKSGGYFLTDGAFYPNQPATREEVAYAVYTGMQISESVTDKSISFRDQADISTDDLEAVKKLNKIGVITGYPDDTFRPKANITRAETAAVLYRGYQHKTTLPEDETKEESKEETAPDYHSNNYFFVVTNVATVLGEKGEAVTKVTGYQEGELQELLISDSVTISHSAISAGVSIQKGDILSYMRDAFGNIISVSVGVNLSLLPRSFGIDLLTIGNTAKRRVIYGTVVKRYKDKGIEILSRDTATQTLYTLDAEPIVYLFQNNKLSLSDLNEITGSQYETGDIVLAYCVEDTLSEIIIVKE